MSDFIALNGMLVKARITYEVEENPKRIKIKNNDLEHTYYFNDREELLSIRTKCFERTSYAIRNDR